MTLANGFLFNQGNLQDYIDCQRRFQLRYILHQTWPAVEAEPFLELERISEQGSRFHKIVRQQLSGIPESSIDLSISDDEGLQFWWRNFNQSLDEGNLKLIHQDGNNLFVELILTVPLGNFRLMAKYDLILIQPNGKFLIIDWKTSKNRPKPKWLENRLQTHVYPFVFTTAGASINGNKQIDPELIEMLYWFTNQPDQPERFYYSSSAFKSDADYLSTLATEINQKTDPVFQLTFNVKHCQFCTYRSLCDRGVKPGELQQLEEWQETGQSPEDVSLDYDQIIEIEF